MFFDLPREISGEPKSSILIESNSDLSKYKDKKITFGTKALLVDIDATRKSVKFQIPPQTNFYNCQNEDSSEYREKSDDESERIIKKKKKAFQTEISSWHIDRLCKHFGVVENYSMELNNVLKAKSLLLNKYIFSPETNKKHKNVSYDKNALKPNKKSFSSLTKNSLGLNKTKGPKKSKTLLSAYQNKNFNKKDKLYWKEKQLEERRKLRKDLAKNFVDSKSILQLNYEEKILKEKIDGLQRLIRTDGEKLAMLLLFATVHINKNSENSKNAHNVKLLLGLNTFVMWLVFCSMCL